MTFVKAVAWSLVDLAMPLYSHLNVADPAQWQSSGLVNLRATKGPLQSSMVTKGFLLPRWVTQGGGRWYMARRGHNHGNTILT